MNNNISLLRKITASLLFLLIIPIGYWMYKTYSSNKPVSKQSQSAPTPSPSSNLASYVRYGLVASVGDNNITINETVYPFSNRVTIGLLSVDPIIISDQAKVDQALKANKVLDIKKTDIRKGDVVQLIEVNEKAKLAEGTKPGVISILVIRKP